MGGIGGIQREDNHRVTGCLHDHHSGPKSGAAQMSSVTNDTTTIAGEQKEQTTATWNLNDWFRNKLEGGKQRLLRFWQGGEGTQDNAAIGTPSNDSGKAATISSTTISPHAAAVSATAAAQQPLQETPYFQPLTDTQKEKEHFLQRIKIRIQELTGHLPGKFSDQEAFSAKQGKSREDLRRHSRFRTEDQEIECILTDDSYLLDSYDRKGEYSKLSVKDIGQR